MGNGCCGSREDWCSGSDKELKKEMYDLKYQSKKNAYLLNDIKEQLRPQRQPPQHQQDGYNSKSPNTSQYSPDIRNSREQGNNSDDGRSDKNNESQGRNGGSLTGNNLINESIISDKLLQQMSIIRQGRHLAKNYRGNLIDQDQNTVVEISMHLEIDLQNNYIVGFIINQGQTELVGSFYPENMYFKLTWKGVSKEDVFKGRFTKEDFSMLDGEVVATFDFDDDEDESTPPDKTISMVEI